VTGETITLGSLLSQCREAVTASTAELVWVDSGQLLAAGVDLWMGVPLWIAAPGWAGASYVDITRAKAAGLAVRPLADTIRDTLAWDLARGGPAPGAEGMTAEHERELLTPHSV
jgi:2'-hydroxyisoflavone reductase